MNTGRPAASNSNEEMGIKMFKHIPFMMLAASICQLQLVTVSADEPEGFTEPFRTIAIAAPESGIIDSIDVREGDTVKTGQVLSRLDQDVLRATLEIARAAKESRGQQNIAAAEFAMKTKRFKKLSKLLLGKHASQEEVDHAQADMEVAKAQVLAAREMLEIKRLEFERTQKQLDRRTIRSPIDGVVVHVNKDAGEFVAPNDPVVMTVVQLDPLMVTFSVSTSEARGLTKGQTVQLMLTADSIEATGAIEVVSPVTNADSGTVRVKVRLPNPNGKYRSGERCQLDLSRVTGGVTQAPTRLD